MYSITKVRKKILIENSYKIKTLWECMCKFGTHGSTLMYLLDEPKDNIITKGIKWQPNTPLYSLPLIGLRVEKVREDGFIFLSLE